VNCRNIYLGRTGDPLTLARYSLFIAEYQANGLVVPDGFDPKSVDARAALLLSSAPIPDEHLGDKPITVCQVSEAYREHAQIYYANDPQMRGKIGRITKFIDEDYGSTEAAKFGPVKLESIRNRWVADGASRPYANSMTNLVFQMFKWAVGKEMVAIEVYDRLKTLAPLRRGKTEARETKAVVAVPIEYVRLTAKKLSPVLKAMLAVHVGTGMRPSELCSMKPIDIDRTGPVWIYRPSKHKNTNKGKTRVVPLVGDVREAVTNYINRPANAFLFSPIESVAWHIARKRAARKTKVQPSQLNRQPKENPKVAPGTCYTKDSYRRAIQRAAVDAGVPSWHPYQLRHLNLEEIADALTLEHAQAMGGHSDATTTRIYAKIAEKKAIEAANYAPRLGGE